MKPTANPYSTRSAQRLTRLLLRLELLDPGERVRIRRQYPGWWQRAAGAWLWTAETGSREICGSCYTVKEVLAAQAQVTVHRDYWGSASLFLA